MLLHSGQIRKRLGEAYRRYMRPHFVETTSLPDFLVVGVQKAGTTFLSYLLSQQIEILPPKIKEIHYFDRRSDYGDKWYKSNFIGERTALRSNAFKYGIKMHRYEATPDYIYFPEAVPKMARLVPDAKLIVILRDPIDRAHSHYSHMKRFGIERRQIDAAIRADNWNFSERQSGTPSKAAEFFSYVDRGNYFSQLRRLFHYYHKEQVMVLFFDDLIKQPISALESLEGFLDCPMPDKYKLALEPQNVSDEKHETENETTLYMQNKLRTANSKLWDLLQVEPKW